MARELLLMARPYVSLLRINYTKIYILLKSEWENGGMLYRLSRCGDSKLLQ